MSLDFSTSSFLHVIADNSHHCMEAMPMSSQLNQDSVSSVLGASLLFAKNPRRFPAYLARF